MMCYSVVNFVMLLHGPLQNGHFHNGEINCHKHYAIQELLARSIGRSVIDIVKEQCARYFQATADS